MHEDLEDTSDVNRDLDTLSRSVLDDLHVATSYAVGAASVVLVAALCVLGVLLGARVSWGFYVIAGAVTVLLYAAIVRGFRRYCAKLRKRHADGCAELRKRHSDGCAKIRATIAERRRQIEIERMVNA